MRRLAALATIAATLTLSACGGSEQLTDQERTTLRRAYAAVAWACVATDLRPDDHAAIRSLVDIYRRKPDATYDSRTVEQVVADLGADLSVCAKGNDDADWEVRRLEAALDVGP